MVVRILLPSLVTLWWMLSPSVAVADDPPGARRSAAAPGGVPAAAPIPIVTLRHQRADTYVYYAEFSPDSRQLVSAATEWVDVRIWDVQRGKLKRSYFVMDRVPTAFYARISPDWKKIYVLTGYRRSQIKPEPRGTQMRTLAGAVRVFDVEAERETTPIGRWDSYIPIALNLSKDGRWLAFSRMCQFDFNDVGDGVTTLVDLKTGTRRDFTVNGVYPVFFRNGTRIVVDDERNPVASARPRDSRVLLMDTVSGKILASVDCPDPTRVFSIGGKRDTLISPDESTLAIPMGGKTGAPIEIWWVRSDNLELLHKIVLPGDNMSAGWKTGRFTPDGAYYIIVDFSGTVWVWDVAKRKPVHQWRHLNPSRANIVRSHGVSFTMRPDSTMMAMIWPMRPQRFCELTLVELPTGRLVARRRIPCRGVSCMTYSPDGKQLALGTRGAVLWLDLSRY